MKLFSLNAFNPAMSAAILLFTTGCNVNSSLPLESAQPVLAGTQVSEASLPEKPVTNEVNLEVVAALPIRPSAVVKTPNGRIFWTEHFGAPNPSQVNELLPNGEFRKYPAGQNFKAHSLRGDRKGMLWMLDMGGDGKLPKLIEWDTNAEKLVKEIEIPAPAYEPGSALQDFVLDQKNNQVIIADTAGGTQPGKFAPALVVVDLQTGRSRRVLEGHASVQAEPLNIIKDGKILMITTDKEKGTQIPSRWGVNGIGIDPKNDWVYYAPMNGKSMYRIPSRALSDTNLTAEELGKQVQRYGDKEIGDGIWVDAVGNVYNTDTQYNAIGVTNAKGEYRLIRRDDKLLNFSEGFEPASDGYLYMATNQANKSTFFQTADTGQPPYYLLRFKPIAPLR